MAKRKNRRITKKPLIANKKYKDTVFRMLFSDRKNLLSLYNAINGTGYADPEKLEIVTLENAIYMGMKNDLAFIIDTNLFLYEHQPTYNANMPLRDLFYIAGEYQKLVDHKSLYSSALQKKEMELDAAVEHAVNECIHEGILAEFLRMNRVEVIAMSIFEYDKEEEEKKLRKAEFEAGVAEGIEQGEMRKAKEIALMLQEMGLSIEEIAHAVNVNKETIRKWLELQEVAD